MHSAVVMAACIIERPFEWKNVVPAGVKFGCYSSYFKAAQDLRIYGVGGLLMMAIYTPHARFN
jgi:hypothetical protein